MNSTFSILKKVVITFSFFCFLNAAAQVQVVAAPEKMSYQAVIRNASNNLVTNQAVGMQISILQGSATGTAVYVETQTPTTNANGLVTLQIGGGTVVSGAMATIDWANGSYFVKTETDPTGGTSYTITGTSQLLSVPYALYAKTSGGAMPTGGTANQVLAKVNGTDYNTQWVTPSAGGGFTHYIGESYLGGIVFYVYKGSDGVEHGLVVSLTHSPEVNWQTTTALRGAIRPDDGTFNTNLMGSNGAKTFIESLGAGWYLPSVYELNLLNQSSFFVEKALRSGSNTALFPYTYWSSTEANGGDAVCAYELGYNKSTITSKSSWFRSRGVKAF